MNLDYVMQGIGIAALSGIPFLVWSPKSARWLSKVLAARARAVDAGRAEFKKAMEEGDVPSDPDGSRVVGRNTPDRPPIAS